MIYFREMHEKVGKARKAARRLLLRRSQRLRLRERGRERGIAGGQAYWRAKGRLQTGHIPLVSCALHDAHRQFPSCAWNDGISVSCGNCSLMDQETGPLSGLAMT